MTPVSIRPSEFVEGGAVPVDKNLLWKEPRFVLFTYPNTQITTVAARLKLIDDDGTEYEQHYSAGDPQRFIPSDDGKTLVPVGQAVALAKSCNFYVLMENLIAAGYPENRLPENGDISVLDGVYAFHIAIPEPKRAGLVREAPAEGARPKIVSVPSKVLRLPWEKKPAGKPSAKAAPKAGSSPAVDASAVDAAVTYLGKLVDEMGSVTRQVAGARVFRDFAKDPTNRDAIAAAVFSADIVAALNGAGYSIENETISKSE